MRDELRELVVEERLVGREIMREERGDLGVDRQRVGDDDQAGDVEGVADERLGGEKRGVDAEEVRDQRLDEERVVRAEALQRLEDGVICRVAVDVGQQRVDGEHERLARGDPARGEEVVDGVADLRAAQRGLV